MIKYDIDALNVSIFHDHKPVFIRHIMLSTSYEKWEKKRSAIGTEVLKWIGEQTALEEKISSSITEIRRIMDFYRFTMNKGEQEVGHILLTGDHPEYKVIENKLRDAFNIAITIFEDKSLKTIDGFRLPLHFYSSLGLAIKEV
ncbi:hypothetical protein [Bacillus taeanensis]|uniref:Uncharacterized protein n=1 Tax=Bacillus taeanensis TaxID=273032 RepID=A0A366Y3L0_9BACI|nr:hypothetical protein [Bacillus taeanensis]RBW71589.1 hypothetical protein DS031_02245 [Bacillus taeanensis]